MKNVAVISDATSSKFFFPIWFKYYSSQFGAKHLFLLTYQGLAHEFKTYELGGVIEVPALYDDRLRAELISSQVSTLLHIFDVVIRCDIDEILIPLKTQYSNLLDFIERCDRPYITARGLDVFEGLNDPIFDYNAGILISQRKNAIRVGSLNKTCITTIPMRWAAGFHSANVFPIFSDLLLFHLKFTDVRGRVEWFDHMSRNINVGSSEEKYFSDGRNKLIGHQHFLNNRVQKDFDLLNIKAFDDRFIASVSYNSKHDIYQGDFTVDDVSFSIPEEFYEIV